MADNDNNQEPRIRADRPLRSARTESLQPVDRPGRYRDLKSQVTTLRALRRS